MLYPPLSDRELDHDAVTGKDRVQLRHDRLGLPNDARATLLQGLASGVLLLGAYFTWRQLQLSRQQLTHTLQATTEQLDATRTQLAIAQEGQLPDRLSRAIEHLVHGTDLRQADLRCAQLEGARHLQHADLRGTVADTKPRWPAGFDADAAGVQLGDDFNK